MLSPITQQLCDALNRLSGIGRKSAQRICFQLLNKKGQQHARALAEAIDLALNQVGFCTFCQNFSETPLCPICSDSRRDQHSLCVLESPADLMAIEQSHSFKGRYFVLHGHLSPIDGIGPQDLNIPTLINHLKDSDIKEVILATSTTMEGEATAHYLVQHTKALSIQCYRIARGIPVGGELEFLDGNTLAHALQSRYLMTEN